MCRARKSFGRARGAFDILNAAGGLVTYHSPDQRRALRLSVTIAN